MPIPSFTGLNTALSGLRAYQTAINETGQNIANASTPGYSRQRVNLTESNALAMPAMSNVHGTGGQLGTGVDISSISRIRDKFLDIQYRAQNATSGAATQASTDLTSAQSAVTTQDITTQLQNFWSAWGTVATATGTGSAAALQTLIGRGTTLAQTFNSVDSQLSNLQSAATAQLTTLTAPTGQVQTDVNQIATLNGQIAQSMAAGQTPNDLLDQRDQALDNLSGFGALTVTNQPNGVVSVGFNLVPPTTTPPTPPTPFPLVTGTTATDLSTLPATAQVSGGQLGALYNDASTTGPIGTLRTSLENVATNLFSSVNALLTPPPPPLTTPPTPPTPPSPFFTVANPPATVAGSIAVAPTTSSLAQAWTANASSIADLQGTGLADTSYSAFIAQVGGAVQSAQSTSMTALSMLSSINSQRQSVSGVSLDEEMTNLITFQQGYQASARVMSTIDAMLNTLINQTGVA